MPSRFSLAPVGVVGAALASLALATPAAARSAPHVAPSQRVATLLATHRVFATPAGRATGSVSWQRPITGERTVLPVLGRARANGREWLRVRLPGRPNSHTGWITARGTRSGVIRWHIVISVTRRAWIYDAGRLEHRWPVVVGTPSTPTPQGQFFVEENIAEPPDFPGAPYALALSARSDVFTEFDGGPGQVALHGIGGGLGGTPGTAESHGCVRFTNADIAWLAARIAPGTPVTIER